jgi:hypothetical protein
MFAPLENGIGADPATMAENQRTEAEDTQAPHLRRQKRVRILIDHRIELTDDELKV